MRVLTKSVLGLRLSVVPIVGSKRVLRHSQEILKVDIEGAEFDLVPCHAQFQQASLIDRFFLEEHTWFDIGDAEHWRVAT